MTKREENQQNSSTKFKIKVTKKDHPGVDAHSFKLKFETLEPEIKSLGLYQQLKPAPFGSNKITYNNFSLEDMNKAFNELFNQKPPSTRNVKIYTTESGMEMFNKAVEAEMRKHIKNEHRKKFSFRSKIFKQAYKFG